MAENDLQQIRLASGLNIIAGLWLIVSPYGFGYYMLNPPFWNSIVIGFLVVVFATIRIVLSARFSEIAWINFAFGAYLCISPFLFGFTNVTAALSNSIASGVFIMLMSAWSAVAGRRAARSSV